MLSSTITTALLVAVPLTFFLALAFALAQVPAATRVLYVVSFLAALFLAVGAGYGPTALFGWVWVACTGMFWWDARMSHKEVK